MKTSSYRIGNRIMVDFGNATTGQEWHEFNVTGIESYWATANAYRDDIGSVWVDNKHGQDYFSEKSIYGILISEQRLIKMGFHKDSISCVRLGDRFIITDPDGQFELHYQTGLKDIIRIVLNGRHHLPVKIKYVHQLQNLWFALTGTELVINENN